MLQEHDLLYAKLKVEKPSIYLKELKNTLASFATVHVSLSTICKSFKHNMNDGSWTRKVLVNAYGERFTPHNMQAPGLQLHLNFKVDLNLRFSLKFNKSVLQSFS